jgi:UDP-N-acetylglucosamine acyltransferase
LTKIHPTAIVDKKAELADDVVVGPYCIIDGDVVIQSGTCLHSHVRIMAGTRIGKDCTIHHGVLLGSLPQYIGFNEPGTTLEIGDENEIREYATMNRGTHHSGKTVVGSKGYFMTYTHVGHDCRVGDRVIIANAVQLGGHVELGDWVIVGGETPVHQFCRIGQHAMIGGGFRVAQDVPPFILAGNEPLTYRGVNSIGLKRRGFSKKAISALHTCYRFLYRAKMNRSQALERIHAEVEMIPEVKAVLEFIEKSERGIIR